MNVYSKFLKRRAAPKPSVSDRQETRQAEQAMTADNESELATRVRCFLHDRAPQLDGLSVTADGGSVILVGKLTSDRDKQVGLLCCQHVAGVIHVIDQIEVSEKQLRPKKRPHWSLAIGRHKPSMS